jgi:hypothetical protein
MPAGTAGTEITSLSIKRIEAQPDSRPRAAAAKAKVNRRTIVFMKVLS